MANKWRCKKTGSKTSRVFHGAQKGYAYGVTLVFSNEFIIDILSSLTKKNNFENKHLEKLWPTVEWHLLKFTVANTLAASHAAAW